MASYTSPTHSSLSVFNPSNFESSYDSSTIDYADTRYLNKSNGGTVSGKTTFSSSSGLVTSSLTSSGSISASSLAIQTNKLVVSSSGLVGIGLTSPSVPLHIQGGDLFLDTSGVARSIWLANSNTDSASSKLRFHNSSTSCYIDYNSSSDGALNIRSGSSLTGVFSVTSSGYANALSGFNINGTNVLNSSTLGSGITASSLTSLGTLTGLNLSTSMITSGSNSVTYSSSLSSSSSGNRYYMSLGGIKLCWGNITFTWNVTSASSTQTSGSTTVYFPTSFFTGVYSCVSCISSVGNNSNQYITGDGFSSSSFKFYAYSVGSVGTSYTFQVSYYAIGY